jgi:hypothetical protein
MFEAQKQPHYHAEVPPMTGTVHISAHIIDPFHKLQSLLMWAMAIHINPENETF